MKQWVNFIHQNNPGLIWENKRGNDYGDWLNGDEIIREGWPQGKGKMPKDVYSTAFFARSVKILTDIARILGYSEDVQIYDQLFNKIKTVFNREFVAEDGVIKGDTQAGYSLALHFELLSPELQPVAFQHLLRTLEEYNWYLSTGFQSTNPMMLELVRRGRPDVAYRLLLNREVPSWSYMIDHGATTIWERWDGWVEGRGFQSPGMNSFNHYTFGSVGEWIYKHIAGIQPDKNFPGFKKIIIHPQPGGGLTWAKGSYFSIHGQIFSSWQLKGEKFMLDIKIPPNTRATVYIPYGKTREILENGIPAQQSQSVKLLREKNNSAVFEVGAGEYSFVSF